MKKFAIGGIVVLLLGGYALWASTRTETPVLPPAGQTNATSTPTAPSGSSGTTTGGVDEDNGIGDSSTPSDEQEGQYKDGVYTGSVGSAAPFGQVQVKATISGGKLIKVETIQAPQGPGYTDELTAKVFPILEKEAISIQSANVKIYTGATQNTEGFQQSLGSALAQAKN